MTDSFNQLQILSMYQEILLYSSKNVSENQDALNSKIPPVTMELQKSLQTAQRFTHEMGQLETNLRSVYDIQLEVQRAQDQLVHIISFLDQIESILPEDMNTQNTPLRSDSSPSEEP
jgi:hypothetical protein